MKEEKYQAPIASVIVLSQQYNFLLNGSFEQFGDMDEGEIDQSY